MRLLLLPLLTMSLVAQTPAPEAAKPEAPKPESAAPAPAPKAAPAKPATPAQPKVDKILARVDGKVIRESDLDAYIAIAYNEQQRMQIAMIEGARRSRISSSRRASSPPRPGARSWTRRNYSASGARCPRWNCWCAPCSSGTARSSRAS